METLYLVVVIKIPKYNYQYLAQYSDFDKLLKLLNCQLLCKVYVTIKKILKLITMRKLTVALCYV